MKQNIVIFYFIVAVSISCNGKDTASDSKTKSVTDRVQWGDTVSHLGNNIMVVYHDSKNIYWFGSWEDGVFKYDGRTLIHFTTKHGLPGNRVEEIKEDKSGIIFINTNAGLCRYDGKQILSVQESSPAHFGWHLAPDDLWFKSPKSGHVYRYDGKALVNLRVPKSKVGEEYLAKHPESTDPYAVYCIYTDSKGNIWFGTALMGVLRYNGKTFDWISESDVTELHGGPANGVRSILEDKEGFFWFNTGYRYKVFDSVTVDRTLFYERHKGIGSLDGNINGNLKEYLSIADDRDKNVWIATYTDGVWKYDGAKVRNYKVRENGREIKLFYICTDNFGNIWLGTHENGAWKLNGEEFIRFKP